MSDYQDLQFKEQEKLIEINTNMNEEPLILEKSFDSQQMLHDQMESLSKSKDGLLEKSNKERELNNRLSEDVRVLMSVERFVPSKEMYKSLCDLQRTDKSKEFQEVLQRLGELVFSRPVESVIAMTQRITDRDYELFSEACGKYLKKNKSGAAAAMIRRMRKEIIDSRRELDLYPEEMARDMDDDAFVEEALREKFEEGSRNFLTDEDEDNAKKILEKRPEGMKKFQRSMILTERDIKNSYKMFLKKNPDFLGGDKDTSSGNIESKITKSSNLNRFFLGKALTGGRVDENGEPLTEIDRIKLERDARVIGDFAADRERLLRSGELKTKKYDYKSGLERLRSDEERLKKPRTKEDDEKLQKKYDKVQKDIKDQEELLESAKKKSGGKSNREIVMLQKKYDRKLEEASRIKMELEGTLLEKLKREISEKEGQLAAVEKEFKALLEADEREQHRYKYYDDIIDRFCDKYEEMLCGTLDADTLLRKFRENPASISALVSYSLELDNIRVDDPLYWENSVMKNDRFTAIFDLVGDVKTTYKTVDNDGNESETTLGVQQAFSMSIDMDAYYGISNQGLAITKETGNETALKNGISVIKASVGKIGEVRQRLVEQGKYGAGIFIDKLSGELERLGMKYGQTESVSQLGEKLLAYKASVGTPEEEGAATRLLEDISKSLPLYSGSKLSEGDAQMKKCLELLQENVSLAKVSLIAGRAKEIGYTKEQTEELTALKQREEKAVPVYSTDTDRYPADLASITDIRQLSRYVEQSRKKGDSTYYTELADSVKMLSEYYYSPCATMQLAEVGQRLTPDEVQRRINTVITAADTYYSKRKGTLFGPFSDSGKARLATAVRTKELANELQNRLSTLPEKNSAILRKSVEEANRLYGASATVADIVEIAKYSRNVAETVDLVNSLKSSNIIEFDSHMTTYDKTEKRMKERQKVEKVNVQRGSHEFMKRVVKLEYKTKGIESTDEIKDRLGRMLDAGYADNEYKSAFMLLEYYNRIKAVEDIPDKLDMRYYLEHRDVIDMVMACQLVEKEFMEVNKAGFSLFPEGFKEHLKYLAKKGYIVNSDVMALIMKECGVMEGNNTNITDDEGMSQAMYGLSDNLREELKKMPSHPESVNMKELSDEEILRFECSKTTTMQREDYKALEDRTVEALTARKMYERPMSELGFLMQYEAKSGEANKEFAETAQRVEELGRMLDAVIPLMSQKAVDMQLSKIQQQLALFDGMELSHLQGTPLQLSLAELALTRVKKLSEIFNKDLKDQGSPLSRELERGPLCMWDKWGDVEG